jgi:WD40 repeat protein/tRNA A-37 threonylcarbamoyl transferase component Bud32
MPGSGGIGDDAGEGPGLMRTRTDADRNLLFGILALQMDFIGRDALIAAMHAWVLDKGKPLGKILIEQGVLGRVRHDLIEALVYEHLQQHGGDPAQSLAAIGSAATAREDLDGIADFELHASLAHLGTEPHLGEDEADQTGVYVGEPTAAGRRFRILRLHERGSLGEVYVARDQELHRDVALKQIKDEHADDAQRRARFLVEAEITGGLEHPGIVPVYGQGQYENGRPFYAMRFIRGDNLKNAIERFHQADAALRDPGERALELRRLLGRFLDVCNAIAYAHSRAVLHRDLKPGNIMLGQFGETLVVDWGLAKSVGRSEIGGPVAEDTLTPESGSDVKSTVEGVRVGTPAFMSPEQAAGRLGELGPASDVYSLGATLYSLLTGQLPFADRNLVSLLRKVERGEFPPPRSVNAQVDRTLDAICRKAMALRPADRYGSPRALADDIEHWLADEPVSALPETWGGRLARWARRHRTSVQAGVAALLLVTLISVVAAGLVNQARTRAEERRREADTQRGLAEGRRREADTQRGLAVERRREADQQRFKAERHLERLALETGLNLCAQGDLHRGILWLAHAFQIAPADSDEVRHAIRLNLDAWRQQFHLLLKTMEHESAVSDIAFSPDGKVIATASVGKGRLWDAATLKPIGPPLLHPLVFWSGMVVVFSPDGKAIATAGDGCKARLWDAVTGKPIGLPLEPEGRSSFSIGGGGGTPMAFSPDGKIVATAGKDSAQLWDAVTTKPIGSPLQHKNMVTTVVFSPNGKVIATASEDNTARLWDVATLKPVGPPMQQNRVRGMAFSPDGKVIAIAGFGGGRLWDAATLEPIGPPMPHQGYLNAVVFSPDGKVIATVGGDNTARLWDAATARPIGSPLLHHGQVKVVAFSPDGKIIATAGDDHTARLWDTASSLPMGSPLQHHGRVRAVAFSPDGTVVATASDDKTARLWDAVPSKPIRQLPLEQTVTAVIFSPDGKFIASGNRAAMQLWDAGTLKLKPPPRLQGPVGCVAFSPGGKIVATSSGGIVRLLDAATLEPIGPPMPHQSSKPYQSHVSTVAFSPDGKVIASTNTDHTVRLWDAATSMPIGSPLQHRNPVDAVAFSPDGKVIATACAWSSERLRLWDVGSLKPIGQPLKRNVWVRAIVFSPDGKLIATAETGGVNGNTAWLWDATTLEPIGPPLKHQDLVKAVVFSPDGKLVATASDDQTARLWNVATLKPIGPPLQHQGRVSAVAFHPDGKLVATASDDQTARLWDVVTAMPIGPPLMHQGPVTALAFRPDGTVVVTAGDYSSAQLSELPTPVAGDAERIVLWTQVLSNMELDDNGISQTLGGLAWERRRLNLEGREVPPATIPPSSDRVSSWHQREAASSEQAGQWFAARWHLDRLIAATPADRSLYLRRGSALKKLGRLAEAEEDYGKAKDLRLK